MPVRETVRHLPDNSRFYILLSSILASVFLACTLRQQITGDQLFTIRLAQIFGFTSLGFLYATLLMTPLSKLAGAWRGLPQLLFARRAIGVAAFYFALLHFSVAFWGQLGGLSGLNLLPVQFITALAFGLAVLVILMLMAVTSVDTVIRLMSYRRWKWLQRSVYVAGVLIILHVWIIGTHTSYGSVQLIGGLLLALLFGLEAWRIGNLLAGRYPRIAAGNYTVTVMVYLWLAMLSLLVIMAGRVTSYHGEHRRNQGVHNAH